MTLEMINLNQIKLTKNNPRKFYDEKSIEGLADSIKNDGLLQNLVVHKPNGKKSYDLVSGERRYRALTLLVKNGDLPKDVQIPAEVRTDLTKDDALRIATIENLQREDMHPLEEADAIIEMMQSGMDSKELSAQTGISQGTIKRRLCFANLSPEVREQFLQSEVSISQAEALSLGTHEEQNSMLPRMDYMDADDIKRQLTNDKVSMSKAIFDLKDYTGTYLSDLFSDEETTYFNDMTQFWELQRAAAQEKVEALEKEGFEPAQLMEGHFFQNWQYDDAPEDETGGAVVYIDHGGEVKVYKGINERVEIKPEKEKKPRASYSAPLREYIAMHKSLAVQSALLDNPRIAKELAIVQMLKTLGIGLKKHSAIQFFNEEERPQYFNNLQSVFQEISTDLALKEDTEIESFLNYYDGKDADEYYAILKHQTDENLDKIHLFLSTICFGQKFTNSLDTSARSLFNLVAQDLNIDMRNHWIPDEAFLKRRTMDQLKAIIKESGLTTRINATTGTKKGELVKALEKNFKRIKALEKPKKGEQKAANWLPSVFEFPAIDPDIT